MTAPHPAEPGFLARIGLAVIRPRWALALASDRRVAGRSGTDLIVVILLVLAATQLRGLFGAAWLATDVEVGLGLRAAMRLLTRALTVDLAFLVLGAVVLWIGAGKRRDLGRAFDLACVAALPLLLVALVVTAAVRGLDVEVPTVVGWALAGVSWGWAGVLLALAWRPARVTVTPPPPPPEVLTPARRTGLAVLALALVGVALQTVWIVRHLDTMRPVTSGQAAPVIALPTIGPRGELGPIRTLTPGKVTVVDFWATWCGPCLKAMPKLDEIARRRTDVDVITINLDDPAAARALFDERGYKLELLADDGQVSERYGVTSIPHSVVIDRQGVVRDVARGSTADIDGAITRILGEPLAGDSRPAGIRK